MTSSRKMPIAQREGRSQEELAGRAQRQRIFEAPLVDYFRGNILMSKPAAIFLHYICCYGSD
jgi:hypothetical protein